MRPFHLQNCRKYAISKLIFENFSAPPQSFSSVLNTRKPSCRWQTRATLLKSLRSRASKVTPFDSLHMVSYHRHIVTLCLKCTVFDMWRHIFQNRLKTYTPLSFGTFLGGDPLRSLRRVIPCQKVKSWGYQMVYISRSCIPAFALLDTMWQTYWQTD